jgi:DNA-binding NarL/FixJ family response regulator
MKLFTPIELHMKFKEREITIIKHLACGLQNKEIAARIHLSSPSVSIALGRIKDKIYRHTSKWLSRREMTIYAYEYWFYYLPNKQKAD